MISQYSCKVNDGAKLHYLADFDVKSEVCIILIHGFSGSSKYFKRNFETLSQKHRVVAYDLRGHGDSTKGSHGWHLSRQVIDLHDLIGHLRSALGQSTRFVGIGCSLGAAILWSYTELFTTSDFDKFVFVDQAPLQNYTAEGDWGPSQGHYGCHDAASLAWNQASMILDYASASKGLVAACLGYRFQPSFSDEITKHQYDADESFFLHESSSGDPRWLAQLMGDHTQHDHRSTIRNCVVIPTLVMAGKRSGCFPVDGTFETARLINAERPGLAKTLLYESGHWLFYEESSRFNADILAFIDEDFDSVAHTDGNRKKVPS